MGERVEGFLKVDLRGEKIGTLAVVLDGDDGGGIVGR